MYSVLLCLLSGPAVYTYTVAGVWAMADGLLAASVAETAMQRLRSYMVLCSLQERALVTNH